jgi:RNA recognition motif-containing protein
MKSKTHFLIFFKRFIMNIYLGNLANDVSESDLREVFEPYGAPTSVSIIKDKFTHEPRGFAFVEMATDDASNQAIAGLNGTELKGKLLKVNEARSRNDGGRSRDNNYGNRSNSRY